MATASTQAADAAGSVQEHPPHPGRPANRVVPDAIERRYLRVDDRYFFPDRTLAFIDQGSRIKVRTHNQEVMHGVVAIALARGWTVVQLTGTHEFRQGMWHEATMRGIEARGYEPGEVELQQVQRALERSRQPPQCKEQAHEGPGGPGAGAGPDDRRAPRDGPRPPVRGVLLAAAAAPYLFDPAQRMSYCVTIQTEVGERTLWGVDLERALAESRSSPRIGDEVVLSQRGARPVTVRVPERNAEGALVGEKKVLAQRASWTVEKPDFLDALARKAALVRSGDLLSSAVLTQDPDLANAAAGLKLARQFVQRVTSDADSRERLLQAIRDRMAQAVEQGVRLHLPERRTRASPPHHRARAGRTRDDPAHARP